MFHSFIAVVASALAVFAAGFFVYSAINLKLAADTLLDNLQVQAFISLTMSEIGHSNLQQAVQELDESWIVTYISRTEAAQEFASEFDPELFDVLKENPLPASFRIDLPPQKMHPDSVAIITERISAINGIDDVIYDRELLRLLHTGMNRLTVWGVVIAGIATVLAVGMTFNAIRLKIHVQHEAITLMSLLGATPNILNAIHWLQGVILGTVGGAISTAVIMSIATLIRLRLTDGIQIAVPHYYLLVVGGALLGFLGSALAVKKFLTL
jgi:cell division transport system permease protein